MRPCASRLRWTNLNTLTNVPVKVNKPDNESPETHGEGQTHSQPPEIFDGGRCVSKISTFWLALIIGVAVEGTLCALTAKFARFGPCGPGNDITGYLLFIHLPALRIAQSLPQGKDFLMLPVTIILTAALWSAIAFLIISAIRMLRARMRKHTFS